jgi:general nucleoside transport system permease protein
MDERFLTLLLAAAVALSAPLLFAALGELVSERAGVINIGLEGMMLAGAFAGVLGAQLAGSPWLGFPIAALGGVLVAALHGVLCFRFGANQVVSGVVLNILALGATTFLLSAVLAGISTGGMDDIERLSIPVLSEIPIVGPALFDQTPMVYLAYLSVGFLWWALRRTSAGLAVSAAGERPEAAASLGVDVRRVRWLAVLACGAMAGIGGGLLALAGLGFFTQNMTAGRGFIALAAVVFGRWQPIGTAVAVLLFAIADAFQIRAQTLGIGIPYQFLVILPYVVTLLALALFQRRMRPPSALGIDYRPE